MKQSFSGKTYSNFAGLLILTILIALFFVFSSNSVFSSNTEVLRQRLKNNIRCRIREASSTMTEIKSYEDMAQDWENVFRLLFDAGCASDSAEINQKIIENLTPVENRRWPDNGGDSKWYKEVGIPKMFGEALIKGIDAINDPQLKERLIRDYKNSLSHGRVGASGSDSSTSAYIWLMGYAITGDAHYLDNFNNCIIYTGSIERWGDYYPDGSYFYHGKHWSFNYGLRDFRDGALSIDAALGIINIDSDLINDYYDYLKNSFQWIYVGPYIDPSVQNKWPWCSQEKGGDVFVKRMIDITHKLSPQYDSYLNILTRLENNLRKNYSVPDIFYPIGAKTFPFDNFLVARRNNFYSSIKLISPSSPYYESTSFSFSPGIMTILRGDNLEDKLGPWDGVHMDESNIYFHPHQLVAGATVRSSQITELYGIEQKNYQNDLGMGSFVKHHWGYYGITSLSDYFGLAGENLLQSNIPYVKSWFILDNKIIILVAGNNLSGLSTYLDGFRVKGNNFRTDKGSFPVRENNNMGDLKYIYHDGFGYYFPSESQISSFIPESGYSSIIVNHNRQKDAVVVFPKTSLGNLQGFVSSPSLEIIKNDTSAQIIKDRGLNFVGASIFKPYSGNLLGSNSPAYIMYRDNGNNFSLSLYNPNPEPLYDISKTLLHYNPLLDYDYNGTGRKRSGTYTPYEIVVPFRIEKAKSVAGFNGFRIESYQGTKSKIILSLRVRRKFEFSAEKRNGVYVVKRASVGLYGSENTGQQVVASSYCGDGSCNNGETCSTCPTDCGVCPTPHYNLDINQDNKVDIQDLGILLSNWGKTDKGRYDINQDGKTDNRDFAEIKNQL